MCLYRLKGAFDLFNFNGKTIGTYIVFFVHLPLKEKG